MASVPLSMQANQQTLLFAETRLGTNEAPTVAPLAWTVNTPNLVILVPSVDGLACAIRAIGNVGTCTVTVSGMGQVALSQSFLFTITPALADTLIVTAELPTSQ